METLFALGNGYLGIRGATDLFFPGVASRLFVAGVYDRKSPLLPYSEVEFVGQGQEVSVYGELVPLPSPLRSKIQIDGRETHPGETP